MIMYKCEIHGELDSEWCDGCEGLKPCDCSDITTTRIKDFIYDCKDGERTVTITLHHCETCGDPSHADV